MNRIILLLLASISFIVGCAPSVTSIPTSTNIPVVPSPSETATREVPTSTPSATFTLAPIPTLSVDDARARLLELLATNGNCHFPCLWGITPGKSTYQEAQAILAPLSGISEITGFRNEGGTVSPVYPEGNLSLNVDAGFLSNNDQIVSHVTFRAAELQKIIIPNSESVFAVIFDSNIYGERLRPYMLPNILSEQGVPAAVLIATDGGAERDKYVPGFYILLFYPDQGLLISYTVNRKVVNGMVLGCPANARVELELYPSGNGDSFSKFLSQTDWANLWPVPPPNPFWKTIDQATSMSLKQFYETFRQPTKKCIETPIKIWPTPEPGGG